ncbi:MAG: sn-glycerol-1-phosphate dehydrogenase [Lentisphaeria bacterium]|nr:sn-glycerol-1-phosphate dehydrogenase [Lentisphaeria bacterium]
MDLIDLPSGIETKAFAMGEHAIDDLPEVLEKFFPGKSPLLVADENTWAAAGKRAQEVLEKSGAVIRDTVIYDGKKRLHPDTAISDVLSESFDDTVVPVAVGSGVINDIVKCAAGKAGVPYCCVPTAASVDGYTASGAAMSVKGFKMTVPCPAPLAIVTEISVLRDAPTWMLSSGYADLMTKVPAGADWIIADIMGEEKIDPEVWDLVQKNIRKYVSDPSDLGNVFAGLAATGYAMQLYGTSRPASGFEHLCSHVWEMEKLSLDGEEISHGFKAGFGSLISTLLMQYLLDHSAGEIAQIARPAESEEERKKNIERLLAKGCYGDKVFSTAMSKFKQGEDMAARRREILEKWESFKAPVRERIIPFPELREMLKKAGCPYKAQMIGLDKEQLTDGVRRAQLIRVRYNVADLLYESGVLDDAIKTLDVLFE